MRKPSVRRLVICAVFAAIALSVFVLESYIPPIVPIPGVKLGLSNIVVLLTLVLLGPWESLAVCVVRVVLGSLLTGTPLSMLYSLGGGLLSLAAMIVVFRFLKNSGVPIVSIFGAFFHNIGQIAVAVLLIGAGVVAYLPVLLLSGAITGLFTGLVSAFVAKRLGKLRLFSV